jgi:hypothetical protein
MRLAVAASGSSRALEAAAQNARPLGSGSAGTLAGTGAA